MAIHDAYARRTPYELAFPDPEEAEARFGAIREALEGDPKEGATGPGGPGPGEDASLEPGRFVVLPAVADVLESIRDPRGDRERAHQHGLLVYHAYHFHRAGRPLYLLGTHAARYLVEAGASPEPGGSPGADAAVGGGARAEPDEPGVSPPEPAGYLQLPRHLFWTRPGDDAPPEHVNGLFWTVPDGRRLSVLVVSGMRDDRPGFSVVPLPPVPLADAPEWLRIRVRDGGRDFESTLPGGEMERLYSVESLGEVLKLVARVFRHLERVPGAAEPRPAPDDADPRGPPGEASGEEPAPRGAAGPDDGGHGPGPSRLPYRRIELEPAPGGPEPGGERA